MEPGAKATADFFRILYPVIFYRCFKPLAGGGRHHAGKKSPALVLDKRFLGLYTKRDWRQAAQLRAAHRDSTQRIRQVTFSGNISNHLRGLSATGVITVVILGSLIILPVSVGVGLGLISVGL